MKTFLLLFIGGGLGSVCRYLLTRWFYTESSVISFGTLAANLIGCLCIGLIIELLAYKKFVSKDTALFLATGFCGGLTTFSTFILENSTHLSHKQWIWASTYTAISLFGGLLAIHLGIRIARFL